MSTPIVVLGFLCSYMIIIVIVFNTAYKLGLRHRKSIEFSVTTRSFLKYATFKKEAEEKGWKFKYNQTHIEKNVTLAECLHFHNGKFAFSDIGNMKTIDLDQEWELAMNAINQLKTLEL